MEGGSALASQEAGHLIFVSSLDSDLLKTAVKRAGNSIISKIRGKGGFNLGGNAGASRVPAKPGQPILQQKEAEPDRTL